MKDQYEPRSDVKANSIWDSARIKEKKKMWNFHSARTRGKVAELPNKIKPKAFRSPIYIFGPYEGTLEEIKQFARMKGLTHLQNGAIKYRVA